MERSISIYRRLSAVALAVLVAGCAELSWRKDGVGAAVLERDLDACRKDARLRAHHESWPAVIAGARVLGFDAQSRQAVPYTYRLETERFLVEHDLTRICMRGKGYELAPAPNPRPARLNTEG